MILRLYVRKHRFEVKKHFETEELKTFSKLWKNSRSSGIHKRILPSRVEIIRKFRLVESFFTVLGFFNFFWNLEKQKKSKRKKEKQKQSGTHGWISPNLVKFSIKFHLTKWNFVEHSAKLGRIHPWVPLDFGFWRQICFVSNFVNSMQFFIFNC